MHDDAHFHHCRSALSAQQNQEQRDQYEIPFKKVSTKLDNIFSLSLSIYIYMIDSLVNRSGISAATTSLHCTVWHATR
jgi:hypothetical protein